MLIYLYYEKIFGASWNALSFSVYKKVIRWIDQVFLQIKASTWTEFNW